MFFKSSRKVVHFGGAGYRDFTLASDPKSVHYIKDRKERNKIKQAYQSRHAGDRLTDPESPGSLSYYVLWQMPSMKGGMRTYEKTFSYTVVDKTSETYSPDKVKEFISS